MERFTYNRTIRQMYNDMSQEACLISYELLPICSVVRDAFYSISLKESRYIPYSAISISGYSRILNKIRLFSTPQ